MDARFIQFTGNVEGEGKDSLDKLVATLGKGRDTLTRVSKKKLFAGLENTSGALAEVNPAYREIAKQLLDKRRDPEKTMKSLLIKEWMAGYVYEMVNALGAGKRKYNGWFDTGRLAESYIPKFINTGQRMKFRDTKDAYGDTISLSNYLGQSSGQSKKLNFGFSEASRAFDRKRRLNSSDGARNQDYTSSFTGNTFTFTTKVPDNYISHNLMLESTINLPDYFRISFMSMLKRSSAMGRWLGVGNGDYNVKKVVEGVENAAIVVVREALKK